ncbi:hypothetical protein DY000_02042481 [Brassica cretica]|uniref:Uncharacterized protein n=1 Tax=Brassica cretica TaxID=69181 RepID=A0ABQ7B747_BRACR|nr:hypothetical protein DY000_02042481 [Brassica cretica]
MSSKSRRKIPTSHVSSEFRRKWPTEFRRLQIFGFRRKLVGNSSQTSDDIEVRRNSARFLVVNVSCFVNISSGLLVDMLGDSEDKEEENEGECEEEENEEEEVGRKKKKVVTK